MAYQPPQQSLLAQVIDVAILVILTVGSLDAALSRPCGRRQDAASDRQPDLGGAHQNAVEQQQWRRSASPILPPPTTSSPRFDYTFSWAALIVMAIVVIGYFVLVVRLSDKDTARSSPSASPASHRRGDGFLEHPRIRRLDPFGGVRDHHAVYDLFRVDTTYSNDLLTSSREGEIELTQERHQI
jgi:hypothetical protein